MILGLGSARVSAFVLVTFVAPHVLVMLLTIRAESLWIDEFWTAVFADVGSLRNLVDLALIPNGSQTPIYFFHYFILSRLFESTEWMLRLGNLPWFVMVHIALFVALLIDLANRFERQGSGAIGSISSPAGDRGQASRFVFGAAKAAVIKPARGMRHLLAGKGVRVITILPGFVDTPMTASLPKGPLWAAPEKVAADIDRALARGFGAVYTPWL